MESTEKELLSKKRNAKIRGQGHPKDTVYSLLFADNVNFAQVFNKTILKEAPLRPEGLTEGNIKESSYLSVTDDTHTLLTLYRDVLKDLADGTHLAILGVENQDDIDYAMPLRVMAMEFINYARQANISKERRGQEEKEGQVSGDKNKAAQEKFKGSYRKSDRLIPCITLVVYWGAKKWDGPRSLSEMFVETPWADYASGYCMNLLDVRHMPEKLLESFEGELKAVFGAARYSMQGDGAKLQSFIRENNELYNNLSDVALDAISRVFENGKFPFKAEKHMKMEGGNVLITAIDELILDGEARGRAQGEALGEARGRAQGEALGEARGRAQGEALGEARGKTLGKALGEAGMLHRLWRKGILTLEAASEEAGQTPDAFLADVPLYEAMDSDKAHEKT